MQVETLNQIIIIETGLQKPDLMFEDKINRVNYSPAAHIGPFNFEKDSIFRLQVDSFVSRLVFHII